MTSNRFAINISTVLYVAALAAVSAIFFSLFSIFNISFWISLFVSCIALTAIWGYAVYIIRNLDQVKRFVPGYTAIGTVLVVYFAAVIIYSLFTNVAHVALRGYLLVHVLTMVSAIILVGLIMIWLRSVEDRELDTQSQVVHLQQIEMALQELERKLGLLEVEGMEEVRRQVAALIENVRYSDPVTPKAIMYTDHQLLADIQLLSQQMHDEHDKGQPLEANWINQRIADLQNRLSARNQQVLMAKS